MNIKSWSNNIAVINSDRDFLWNIYIGVSIFVLFIILFSRLSWSEICFGHIFDLWRAAATGCTQEGPGGGKCGVDKTPRGTPPESARPSCCFQPALQWGVSASTREMEAMTTSNHPAFTLSKWPACLPPAYSSCKQILD